MVPNKNVVGFGPKSLMPTILRQGERQLSTEKMKQVLCMGKNGNGGSLGRGFVFLSEELEHSSLGSAGPWSGFKVPLCSHSLSSSAW